LGPILDQIPWLCAGLFAVASRLLSPTSTQPPPRVVKHFKHDLLAALCKYLRGYCSIQWNKRASDTEKNNDKIFEAIIF